MTLLIVGTIGLDTIETPFGKKTDILGGSGIHAAMSASFWTKSALVGVTGEDFPAEHLALLRQRGIELDDVKAVAGETFRWSGAYEYDMNQAHTRDTKLNVLLKFDPNLSDRHRDAEFVFLANLDPVIQLKVLDQLRRPKLTALDTMNFWIENKKDQLLEAVKRVDVIILNDAEAREFMETPNLPIAAGKLLALGPKVAVIKKGEHGALLFTRESHFAAPSYPQDKLRDPTGAGDSFAGGFMGYLAKNGDLSEQNLRRAVIVGSVMASFNVEDFSLDRLKTLTNREISGRFEEFKRFSEFEALTAADFDQH